MSRGCRVLIVDDHRDAADTLAVLLDMHGFLTSIAYRGADVLPQVREHRPDVVLLDITLPDVDGYELARRIRAEAGDASPMLGAVTGWGHADDKRRALDAGFDRHFTKPVDPDDVIAWLATVPGRCGAAP